MSSQKPLTYKIVRAAIELFYPDIELVGTENIPAEGSVLVGNHSQAHGPIISELRFPFPHKTWCIGQVMDSSEAAEYAYNDFWSAKPKAVRWFFRLLSRIIARPLSTVLSAAETIPVFHDERVIGTLRKSVEALEKGLHLVIFPEFYKGFNHFLCRFQTGFIDTARLYYKHCGKCLAFVPMYVAPKLKKVFFGEPVYFNPEASVEEERERIGDYLMNAVSALALSQPLHTVVPYPNIPKNKFPQNTEGEVIDCGAQTV